MSFQHGLSGLNAASSNLDVIGNNVANANTVGFKTSEAQFSDIFAASASGGSASTAVGIGTSLTAVIQQFSEGSISVTSNPLDLAINGQGFFRMDTNGAVTYTRNGQFQLDRNGFIVNSAGDRLTGYAATATGSIITSAPAALQVSASGVAPSATTAGTVAANLDARAAVVTAPFSLANPASFTSATSMSVFDSLGNPHTLSVYYAKTASNTWDIYAAADGTQVGAGALGTLAFQSNGALDTALSTFPALSIPITNGATTPLAFNLDCTGSTQFGSPFAVTQLTQDGYTSGQLAGFSVDDAGVITARYSNG
ncbi:MAG: flagellar hook protein FlgE, partial [Betaproteobacteria bacterium]|nr:flagellar hook protein FlgE [Betaproteobacteria bacterium]